MQNYLGALRHSTYYIIQFESTITLPFPDIVLQHADVLPIEARMENLVVGRIINCHVNPWASTTSRRADPLPEAVTCM